MAKSKMKTREKTDEKGSACLACLIEEGTVVIGYRRLPGIDNPVPMKYCKGCATRFAPKCLTQTPAPPA